MYAVHLPQPIPDAGQPGGPPLPADIHLFGGGMVPFDPRPIFLACIRDPAQLAPTMQRFAKMGEDSARNTEKLANQLRFCPNSVNIFE